MAGRGFAFEQSERVFDGVDQGPAEVEQLAAGAASENDAGHRSAEGAALCQFAAQIVQSNGLAALKLAEPGLQGGERVGI